MKRLTVYALSFALTLALVAPVIAHETSNRPGGTVAATESARPNLKNLRDRIATKAAQRLQGAKLQACERVEKNLQNYLTKVSGALNRHLAALNRLEDRIVGFADSRGVVSKITNYNELLAKVTSAHSAADAAILDFKDAPSFDCSGDNPKAIGTEARDSFKTAKDALKAYHKALKDLLVAVATAVRAGTATPSGNTP